MSQTSSACTPVSISGGTPRCGTPYSASTSAAPRSASASRRLRRNAAGAGLQGARQFLPDPFRHQFREFAVGGHRAHQGQRLRGDAEPQRREPRHEAGRAGPATVFDEGRADVAQHAVLQVAHAIERIDQRPSSARAIALRVKSRRRRSSSSVTAGSACTTKPAWPRPALVRCARAHAPRRSRVKHREVAAHLAEAGGQHVLVLAPTTTKSRSPAGRPSRPSRTAPPTR